MIKQKGNLQNALNDLRNNDNNAVTEVYEDAKFGKGILSEATVTIKNVFATKTGITSGGSLILKDFQPGYDATVITNLQKAGAAIVGKVHNDELALGGSGLLSAFGEIRNPLNRDRMIGGSSSGSAATLTDNITIAIGSDTGNSVRLPASFVGKVGFKPSYGATSRYGLFPFASSLDHVGWLTHNVTDAIIASQALFGEDPNDMTSRVVEKPELKKVKPKKIAFVNDHGALSDVVKKEYLALKAKCEKDGIQVDIVNIDIKILEIIDVIYEIISYTEATSNGASLTGLNFGSKEEGQTWEQEMINTRSNNLGWMVQKRYALAAYYSLKPNWEEAFVYAQKVRRLVVDTYNNIFSQYELIAFPTTTRAPLVKDGKDSRWHSDFCAVSNMLGCPSLTIPFTEEDNMPVGLLLDSKIYNDKQLLSHALYLEELIGAKKWTIK